MNDDSFGMNEENRHNANPLALDQWYVVEWNDDLIIRHVSPPGKDAWSDQLNWTDIIRVCFEANDGLTSD